MSLAKAIGSTFGTYMIADYLSNYLQHPTQKMDYGVFNQLIGREVDQKWWGTRTEHIGELDNEFALHDYCKNLLRSNIETHTLYACVF